MTLDSPINRQDLFTEFPGLINDPEFKITSDTDPKYNCIAWANMRNNIWWWPTPFLDGVCEWPVPEISMHYSTLIRLFEKQGYARCETYDFDKSLVKVALYVDADNEFTHAARQNRKGLWMSKLGQWFDIIHGTPHTIENEGYGEAKIFMSHKF